MTSDDDTQLQADTHSPRRRARPDPHSIGQTCDTAAAAVLLFTHEKTVLELIECGILPAARLGRSYVMMTRDVLAHLENMIREQTAVRMRRIQKAAANDPSMQATPTSGSTGPLGTRRARRSRIKSAKALGQ